MPRVFSVIPQNIEVVSGVGILTTKDEITVDDINIFGANNVVITVSPNKDALPDVFYRINLLVDGGLVARTKQIAWSAGDIINNKKFQIPIRNVGRLGDDYVVTVIKDITRPVANITIGDVVGRVGDTLDVPVTLDSVPARGLAGYSIDFTSSDSLVAGFVNVIFPPQFIFSSQSGRGKLISASAVDLQNVITGGEIDVLLCTLQLKSNSAGTIIIEAIGQRLDDDDGFPIATTFNTGSVQIT